MDETSAVPSDQFGPATMEALAKAGTVSCRTRPRRRARCTWASTPINNPDLPSAAPKFYLRLVQTVSPNQVITRIVGLDELRGISLPAGPRPGRALARIPHGARHRREHHRCHGGAERCQGEPARCVRGVPSSRTRSSSSPSRPRSSSGSSKRGSSGSARRRRPRISSTSRGL